MWNNFVRKLIISKHVSGLTNPYISSLLIHHNTPPLFSRRKNSNHIAILISRLTSRHTAIIQSGFSLVELLISIGILGILASVAIPSYINFTKNGEVSEALATLMNLSTQMEKRFIDIGSYSCGISIPADATYTFSCSLDAGYTLTASSSDGDSPDYKYTIVQSGARATSRFDGGSPSSGNENCWQINTSGGCY